MARYAYEADPDGESPGQRRLLLALLAAVAVGAGAYWFLALRTPPTARDNVASTYQHIAPFTSIVQRERSWVAEVPVDWPGATDPKQAEEACRRLAKAVGTTADTTVDLFTTDGTPLFACQ